LSKANQSAIWNRLTCVRIQVNLQLPLMSDDSSIL
jgi:hypothetical protein